MKYADYIRAVDQWVAKQQGQVIVNGHEEGFSWRGCPCCGRSEGGNKFRVIVYNHDMNIIEAWDVCEDCMLYLAYGYLDTFNEL